MISNDIDAFERLAAMHRLRALHFVQAFSGGHGAAEDIVQEAFRRLFEHRHQYPLSTRFFPYLMKTIKHICIDEKRSRTVLHSQLARGHEACADRANRSDPQFLLEQREMMELTTAAVAQLPEQQRACLLLVACERLSYKETARVLSMNTAHVTKAVHHARKALRGNLAHILMP